MKNKKAKTIARIAAMTLAVAMLIPLAGCGGTSGGIGNDQQAAPTFTKYVNEGALGNTDNVTISVGKTENNNEEFILNIHAPGLLENLTTVDGGSGSMFVNDLINLRLFRNPKSIFSDAFFSFMGYDEFEITGKGSCNKTIAGEIILEEGCFVLAKREDYDSTYYDIWAKDETHSIKIDVKWLFDKEADEYHLLSSEEDYIALLNTIKDHFTLAKIKTNQIEKNGVLFTGYDVNSITPFGETSEPLNTKDWVFACDLLHKKLEEMSIPLMTAHSLTAEGPLMRSFFTLAETDAEAEGSQSFALGFCNVMERTFDMVQSENEFTINGIRFRQDTGGASVGNGIRFNIKLSDGREYLCYVTPTGSNSDEPLEVDDAKAFLEKVLSAK